MSLLRCNKFHPADLFITAIHMANIGININFTGIKFIKYCVQCQLQYIIAPGNSRKPFQTLSAEALPWNIKMFHNSTKTVRVEFSSSKQRQLTLE
ncbi:CLUMA_CG008863, isoform A [Clunio marinus]|uniref:CLUMA_CG008863, isoform A n=1 Tax=Clunio marinus TaxID=568069 RepID=A0A1J1I594_9DIPT|nr:CLUMA_CG008863, isoform A [Clunio marinus]